MTFDVTPGPLPNDGVRLNVDRDLRAFVNGTTIAGFGPEAFIGSQITFIYAATDAPASGLRTYGFRWFKRGEGNLYQWDVFHNNAGVTEGFWRAVGGSRRDQIHKCELGTFKPGDIAWPSTRVGVLNDYHHEQYPNQRFVLELAPTGLTARWNPHPPFFVCMETTLSGRHGIFAEIGVVNINTMPGATGPGFGCHGGTNFDWRLMQFVQPLTFSNAIVAHILQSEAAGASALRCFLWSCPSHLTK